MNSITYVRLDCDNVGDMIELSLYNSNPHEAQKIHNLIQESIKKLSIELEQSFDADILLIGSDDILFKTNRNKLSLKKLEDIRADFFEKNRITLSIGIGNDIQESLKNLKIAKISGRNRIVQ